MNLKANIIQYAFTKTIKKIIVVEVIVIKNDLQNIKYNACCISRKNNEIKIDSCIEESELEVLSNWQNGLEKKTPILTIVNSEKTLHRIATNGADLKDILPTNINQDDFYIEREPINENQQILSSVRRNYLEDILRELYSLNPEIISISISPAPIIIAYKQINNTDNKGTFVINNYQFEYDGHSLSSLKNYPYELQGENQKKYIFIGIDKIDSKLFPCFSHGIWYFINPARPASIQEEKFNALLENYYYQTFSKIIIASVATILFILLTISTITFNIYHNKLAEIQADYDNAIQLEKTKQILKEELQKQETLLKQSGLLNNSVISYYADQLTTALPEDMYFRKLQIHPADVQSLDDNVTFMYDDILIEGNCYSATELNAWVNTIQGLDWINKVTITEYKQPNTSDIASFKIKIQKKQS